MIDGMAQQSSLKINKSMEKLSLFIASTSEPEGRCKHVLLVTCQEMRPSLNISEGHLRCSAVMNKASLARLSNRVAFNFEAAKLL